jgi:hypothetical protein
MTARQCVFSFASRLFLWAGTIQSDWNADAKVADSYSLGGAVGVECVAGRVRRRLDRERSSGLWEVCQIARVDRFPGGAYLVGDVRWFDCALMPSLGCSWSCSTFDLVLVALLHCLGLVLPWSRNRFL